MNLAAWAECNGVARVTEWATTGKRLPLDERDGPRALATRGARCRWSSNQQLDVNLVNIRCISAQSV